MLGLAQQVNGAHLGVYRLVGDDQGFCWPGKQVDAHAAIQLAFGFGHEHVARAHQHVHGFDGGSTYGHGRHGLYTAQHQDLISASKVHGGNDGRVRCALVRWCCRNDALHTRHLGREHAHVGRGDHGVLAPGHVAAHSVHGDVFVPQHHTGQGLHLDIEHAGALHLRKVANLFLREVDVFGFARAELLHGGFNVGAAEAKVGRVPLVKLARISTHRVVALLLHVLQNGLDSGAHVGVGLGQGGGIFAAFEVTDHWAHS